MLRGKVITLRPIQEDDLPQIYAHEQDLDNRGEYYGLSFHTMTALRKEYSEDGFWGSDRGLFAIIDNASGKVAGNIVWFRTVRYLDEIEIGYILWDQSLRRKGATTEALTMFTNYLFQVRILDHKPVNRIRLCIASGNAASRRVAEKAGYTWEATQRGAAYNGRQRHDMELYAIVRGDPRPN
jgi:[ribosomal protein S5]-alanine N-acetyltransferase